VGIAVLAFTVASGALVAFAGALSAYLLVLVASGALKLRDIVGARQRVAALFGR
jgi:hypothetical protein